jgi:manganese transport protein
MKTALSRETARHEPPYLTQTPDSPDPYRLRPQDVAEPPQTILGILRKTGPGIILAASIVGSGELIATTTLGAQVGYAALWIILLSCLIKPIIQAEWGRYTISSGETGLESFNNVPGPRIKVNWIVWLWAVMMLIVMLQVGAMLGGVSQVMHLLVPAIPVPAWLLVFLALTLLLLLGGGYKRVERLAMIKAGLFTLFFVARLSERVHIQTSRRGRFYCACGLWHHRRRGHRVVYVSVLVRGERLCAFHRPAS